MGPGNAACTASPSPWQGRCASHLTEKALYSWVVKNRRYQLEMRNCGKKCRGVRTGRTSTFTNGMAP